MTPIETLEDIKETSLLENNFKGEITLKQTNEKPHFGGSIDASTLSEIIVNFNPEYEEEAKKEQIDKKFSLKSIHNIYLTLFVICFPRYLYVISNNNLKLLSGFLFLYPLLVFCIAKKFKRQEKTRARKDKKT